MNILNIFPKNNIKKKTDTMPLTHRRKTRYLKKSEMRHFNARGCNTGTPPNKHT